MEFINTLLSLSNLQLSDVCDNLWLKSHVKMNPEEKAALIKQVVQEREDWLLKRQDKRRQRKENIIKAVH